MEAMITLPTTHAVITGEKALLAENLPVAVASLPPALSAGCGLCLRLPIEETARAISILAMQGIVPQGVYLQKGDDYREIRREEEVSL